MADQKEATKTEPPKVKAPPMTIYQAIPHIIGAVAPVSKDRKNAAQGYSFRGVDDIYSALNLLLANAGVAIIPNVLSSERETYDTAKGTKMFRCILRVRYLLIASDGSSLTADVEGEAMDSGDKATPKALSMAYKYMAFQVFCIPTDDKIDTENESHEVVAANGKPATTPAKAPLPEKQAAPQIDPASEALCEEHRQAIGQAKDEDSIKKIGAAILAEHKAHRINDTQRNALKKLADVRRLDLGIVGNGATP